MLEIYSAQELMKKDGAKTEGEGENLLEAVRMLWFFDKSVWMIVREILFESYGITEDQVKPYNELIDLIGRMLGEDNGPN